MVAVSFRPDIHECLASDTVYHAYGLQQSGQVLDSGGLNRNMRALLSEMMSCCRAKRGDGTKHESYLVRSTELPAFCYQCLAAFVDVLLPSMCFHILILAGQGKGHGVQTIQRHTDWKAQYGGAWVIRLMRGPEASWEECGGGGGQFG